MSSYAPSTIDRGPKAGKACLSLLLAAFLAASCDRSEGGGTPVEPDGEPFLTVTSEIPAAIFSGTLRIEGMARPGDTVMALYQGRWAKAVAGMDGFILHLPLAPSDSSGLILFAKGKGTATSDTLAYSIMVPAIGILVTHPFLHTSKDTFDLRLDVKGFDSAIVRVNGESRVAVFTEDYPSFAIPLVKNAPNRIFVRGLWEGREAGDSVTLDLVHDDIPPRLLEQSVYLKANPVRSDSTVILRFDDSIRVRSAFVGGSRGTTAAYTLDRAAHRVLLNLWIGMGELLPLAIKVADLAGNELDTSLDIRTYKERLTLNTPIRSMHISHREGILYAMTHRGGLYVIDTKTWKQVDSIPLPASPGEPSDRRLEINPWNKFLYLIMPRLNRVAIIDPFQKTEVDSLPITPPVYATDIGLAFFENGTGLYFVDQGLEGMHAFDSRAGHALSPSTLFKVENFTKQVHFTSFNANRSILFGQGNSTFEYSVMGVGDTAVTPFPLVWSDRVVKILGQSPFSDIILLSDKRLVDSRMKFLANSLFEQSFTFGKDAMGRDYMLHPAAESILELDRFATTGLQSIRFRASGNLFPVPGTDEFIAFGNNDLVVLDLGEFGSP